MTPSSHDRDPHARRYPHEREILLTPLTGMEVKSVRVDGTVMVVCVELNVNFMSRSLEEVRGQMQESHVQLLDHMRSALVHVGCPQLAIKPLDELRAKRTAQDAEWFNSISRISAPPPRTPSPPKRNACSCLVTLIFGVSARGRLTRSQLGFARRLSCASTH